MFSVTQAYNALVQISPSLPSRGTGLPISPEDVTVLIPCCKKARWVMETVRSVLDQTVFPSSVVVLLMDEESQALQGDLRGLGGQWVNFLD